MQVWGLSIGEAVYFFRVNLESCNRVVCLLKMRITERSSLLHLYSKKFLSHKLLPGASTDRRAKLLLHEPLFSNSACLVICFLVV